MIIESTSAIIYIHIYLITYIFFILFLSSFLFFFVCLGQLYVFGHEAQAKMQNANILIIGLTGLGIEIGKKTNKNKQIK